MPLVLTGNGLGQVTGKPAVAFLELSDSAAGTADRMSVNYTGAASAGPTGYTPFSAQATVSATNVASAAVNDSGWIGVIKAATSFAVGNRLVAASIAAGTWTFTLQYGGSGTLGPTLKIGARLWQVSADLATKTAISAATQGVNVTAAGAYTITLSGLSAVTFSPSTPYLYLEFWVNVTTAGTNLSANTLSIDTISASIPAVTYAPSLAESISAASDSISRLASPVREISENLTAAVEVASRRVGYQRSLSEMIAAPSDSILRSVSWRRTLANVTPQYAMNTVIIQVNGVTPSAPNALRPDLQSLHPGALLEFFVLDLAPLGGDAHRFHAGTNELSQAVVWQGLTYDPWPVQATGFEINSQGQLPRPKIVVSNIFNLISQLLRDYNDLIGAKLVRKRTLLKYLDVVNFKNGINPTADASQFLPDEIWRVDRKAAENKVAVQFELISSLDLAGTLLPRRPIVSNLCLWQYRGPECGWVPGTLYDANGDVVTDPALDVCSKRLSNGCKPRFGATNPLPFGGFPGAGLIR